MCLLATVKCKSRLTQLPISTNISFNTFLHWFRKAWPLLGTRPLFEPQPHLSTASMPTCMVHMFSYIMACTSTYLSLWIVMFCSSAGLPYIWLLTMDSCMQSQCYYRGTTASQIWRRGWETCIVLTSRHEMKKVYHSKWGIVNRPNVTTVQWSVALPTYIILCCDVIYKLHCGSKVYTCILCLHSMTGPLSLPLLVKGTRMLWNTW